MTSDPAAPDTPVATRRGPAPVVWLTGLPSAGKSTIAFALADHLRAAGTPVEVLDGDEIRASLTRGLGFSREDRAENVRRIGFVAHLLSRNGITVLCPVISPYRDDRDAVRALVGGAFQEIWVSTPVEVCAERDVKGLYAQQRAGALQHLTGVDDPYEPPLTPELVLPTHELDLSAAVGRLVAHLAPLLGEVAR